MADKKVTEAVYQDIARLRREEGKGARTIAKQLGLTRSLVERYVARVDAEASGNGHGPPPPTADEQEIPLRQIHCEPDTQARQSLNLQTVAEYVEAMEEGARFPPVVLFFDGDEGFYIGDGFHRIEAARKVGFTTITAEIRPGGQREARLYAAGANATHGLRRTNADKRKAVAILLQDTEWQTWSDRAIAQHCGVTHPFVAKLRQELSGNDYQMPAARQVQRGETVYQMDTSGIGAAPPSERQAGHPRVQLPPPASQLDSQARRPSPWYYLLAGWEQALTDFTHSGGLKRMLAGWSLEERIRARGDLGRLRGQLDRLDAALAASEPPDAPAPEAVTAEDAIDG